MSHTAKVIVFLFVILILIVGMLLLQAPDINKGVNYPKWPAVVLIFLLYKILFGKK